MENAFRKRRPKLAAFGSGVYPKQADEQEYFLEPLLRIEVVATSEEDLVRVFSAIRQRGFVPISCAPTMGPYPYRVMVALPAAAYEAFVQEFSLRARILLRG